ncbi:MAG TPA: hypothetical protein PLP34_06720 [Chitinophagaceae bacterium]|nr:hypothetical protein [Chitinophagaceae bacterium]HNF72084.1 hypothetical protein [Chitinophagaceae bacterium]
MTTTALSFDQIQQLVYTLESENQTDARETLQNYFNECEALAGDDSEQLLFSLFLNALNKRYFQTAMNENIYQKQYEVSQIQLFDILIHRFPFVRISQEICNKTMVQYMMYHTEITLIDIGMGLGTQMIHVLRMAASIPGLKKINLIGIEPFEEALLKAGKAIQEIKVELPFEVQFFPVQAYAEETDFTALPGIQGPVLVNASLALHHIQSKTKREQTLRNIRQLNPLAVLITEPNVNHFESNIQERIQHSYHHFYNLFCVIDQLDIEEAEKGALKLFFGREIEDILGKKESDRFEKHEPGTHWIQYLKHCQFQLNADRLQIPDQYESFLHIEKQDSGLLGFRYQNETILSLICAN